MSKTKKEVTPVKHFFEYFNERIPQNWNQPALTDFDGEKDYTYGQMAEHIAALQVLLSTAGIREGDKVVVCGKNCANWAVAFLSIAANKGVIVSILDAFVGQDIEKLINHSDAKAVFMGATTWAKVNIQNLPNVLLALSLEDFGLLYAADTQQKQAFGDWSEHCQLVYPDGYTKDNVHFPTDNMDDLMIINYTSGTTSAPKGVMLSYRAISANVHYSQETIPNHAGWTEVCMLPLAHMFGMTIEFLYQIAGGCHVYFLSKTPSPTVLMKAYAQTKPYMILTVPLVLEKIIKSKVMPVLEKQPVKFMWHTPILRKFVEKALYDQLMKAFGGNLKWLITGGAALNADVERIFRRIHFPLAVGYGMTEAGPLICYEEWNKEVLGCCGRVVDRNELKIDSANPEKEVGEILFRGDHTMMGYYKNEEATNATLDAEGWLHTGDLGVLDRQGRLFIKGRAKAMILSSNGQNIYPEELEDKLNSMPLVVESVVVEREGKLVGLVYPDYEAAKKDGKDLDTVMQSNLAKLNQQIPLYAKVSAIELVKTEFEKTPKKSIRRFLYK